MATRLSGWDAITLAERLGARLCKHREPQSPPRDDLTPEEAKAIAARDPGLIYIDFDEDVFGKGGVA